MKEYVIYFENGIRQKTIAIDSPSTHDKKNKEEAAKKWKGNKQSRKYMISTDNRANIKLVNGKIVIFTPKPVAPKIDLQKQINDLSARITVLEKSKIGV